MITDGAGGLELLLGQTGGTEPCTEPCVCERESECRSCSAAELLAAIANSSRTFNIIIPHGFNPNSTVDDQE